MLHEDLATDPLLHACNIAIKSQETSLKYANVTELDKELSVVLKLIKNDWPSFKKDCSNRALPLLVYRTFVNYTRGFGILWQ